MKNITVLILIIMALGLVASCSPYNDTISLYKLPNGTKMIAHRGLCSEYYQNTEAAFIAAAESEYFFGIETDVWRTSDGAWVCCHDIDPFDDTAKKINEITLNEALGLSLSLTPEKMGYSIVMTEDVYICTYEKYLDICIENNKMPIIEIKIEYTEIELNELINIASSKIVLDKVQFISFKPLNIQILYGISDMPYYQVLSSNVVGIFNIVNSGQINYNGVEYDISNYDVGIKYEYMTPENLEILHANGVNVNVYTVNNADTIAILVEMGVDYITCDYIFESE